MVRQWCTQPHQRLIPSRGRLILRVDIRVRVVLKYETHIVSIPTAGTAPVKVIVAP